jgi:hypothetical protein
VNQLLAAILVALSVSPAIAQVKPRVQFTKEQLIAEVAGICRNPDATFPTPVPAEKRAALDAYCSCIQSEVNRIPESKLQQAAEETFSEYAQYKKNPDGFLPVAEFSLIRISKACIKK